MSKFLEYEDGDLEMEMPNINRLYGVSEETESNAEQWLSQAHTAFILAYVEQQQACEEAVISRFLASNV